ncbi:MAG TPA: rhamnulokinase family protein [Vicinamibacteria bacterium]|nr:rhamnulokinase family protein [Vicinamibacteria bacterium]
MGQALSFLAADLGAESGRVMVGRFDGDRLSLSEAHRFDSRPVRLPDGLHTDALRIFSEIQHGLAAAAAQGGEVAGIGVDTWGVDFALLDADGLLLGNPYHYRDAIGGTVMESAFGRVPRAEIFGATGVQLLEINTLFQLLRLQERGSAALREARRLLMMPDLFSYWLCGRAANEYTIATTSQCLDVAGGRWATSLLERFSLPAAIFGEIVPPGALLGDLLPHVAEEAGLPPRPVIAVGGHDTALAVAAVPAARKGFAYVSSGTWSLLGAEIPRPCVGEASLAANFTNEGGVGGTIRFLKNLCGLWLVQECRRHWARHGEADPYDRLAEMAAAAPAFRSLVDVDAPDFAAPGDMPARIQAYCRRTRQPAPETKGEIVRAALDSLALKYRYVLAQMEGTLQMRLDPLHVVGGGARNRLLCQLAADATGRAVVAGPVEATAAGNVLMQALALGHLGSLAEARDVVRRSFEIATYEPRRDPAVEDAYARLLGLVGR